MENLLNVTAAPLSLTSLAVNLLLGIVLGSLVAWYYTAFGKSFSNRSKLAATLPVLVMITALIISIVKSSLALSLGLVGALSIVRFRTAIKEPEELIYLFLAIAIGLGLGADQRSATILATVIILGYLLIRTLIKPRPAKSNLFLNVITDDQDDGFQRINEQLEQHVEMAELRRLDHNESGLQATYLIKAEDGETLSRLMDSLRADLPGCELSFVEQDNALNG
ncbi:MAG: DUF4956 domain-containing protein [Chloroflexi bacterium]|jgi:uncharacterized membrane protein YhiD involved in acid resistance|nr:DUF4956 domain-containing protein [Chloroflexota bacterium]